MEEVNMNLQLFAQEAAEVPAQPQAPTAQQTAQEELLQQQFQEHMQKLQRQAEELKLYFPDFDLREELKNPVFVRLTAPGVGIRVEDAFYAVHRRELQEAAVQAAKRQVANAIAAGAQRPQEHGLSGQASAVSAFDYRSASKEQRDDLKRRIRMAAAEGKKLYPGSNRI